LRTFTNPRGKTYQFLDTGDRGAVIEEAEPPPSVTAAGAADPQNTFHGTARRAAKLSFADGQPKPYQSVSALLEVLKPDRVMAQDHDITKARNSKRVATENHNVTVTASIYAVRREKDNDYHVILGDRPGSGTIQYINAEVSGLPLPGEPSRAELAAVRSGFKDELGFTDDNPPVEGSYITPPQPIAVQVTGSLFWDIEHPPPNTVGPAAHRPRTAWEIHPVRKIEFER
jgi:hypothetical protein